MSVGAHGCTSQAVLASSLTSLSKLTLFLDVAFSGVFRPMTRVPETPRSFLKRLEKEFMPKASVPKQASNTFSSIMHHTGENRALSLAAAQERCRGSERKRGRSGRSRRGEKRVECSSAFFVPNYPKM